MRKKHSGRSWKKWVFVFIHSSKTIIQEDSDVWDKFNLDDYDDEPGIIDPGSIGALVHEGEDEYTPVGEFDKEDEEDLVIKPEDHVLLAGVDSPEGTAAIEVFLSL